MKKIIALLLTVTIVLPCLFAYAEQPTEKHWAEDYIVFLKDRGIVKGDSNGNVNPDNYITRAEFAQITNLTFGYSYNGTDSFNDVSSDKWYYEAMNIAKSAGYFKGDNLGNGNPDKQISRAEASVAIARILGLDTSDNNTGFSDDNEIPSWAKGSVLALKKAGIIN